MTRPSSDGENAPPAPAADQPADPWLADPWLALRRSTPARIGLGRTGASLPTREILRFGLAHAQARDAVHAPFDAEAIAAGLAGLGLSRVIVSSRAPSREVYLRRPDLGRALAAEDAARLATPAAGADLALIIGDGLSATAVHANALPVVAALLPRLKGLSLAPVVVARQARVALGDAIGAALGARLVVMLIGERPGLSAPDSLGAYLTAAPRPGRTDAERNCLSNIRAAGMPADEAAFRIAWLVREGLTRGVTGVTLKDESGRPVLPGG